MDIFGHCIACANWKSCCWKNIDPLCIAKQDGCHVIRAQAEKELAVKEVQSYVLCTTCLEFNVVVVVVFLSVEWCCGVIVITYF